jgi:hypothetical protein
VLDLKLASIWVGAGANVKSEKHTRVIKI